MQFNNKDLASGGIFVLIGGFFAGNALINLRMGSATSMGPGYFPIILGSVLIALGIAIALNGRDTENDAIGDVPWRGIFLIIGSIAFFGAVVRDLGFGPTLFLSIFASAMASNQLSWKHATLLAGFLAGFSIVVFIYALGLPYPIFGPWLKF